MAPARISFGRDPLTSTIVLDIGSGDTAASRYTLTA